MIKEEVWENKLELMESRLNKQFKISEKFLNYLMETMYDYKAEMQKIERNISEAASLGDLKENREYELAKQDKELQQHKIDQLNKVLESAVVAPEEENKVYKVVEPMTRVKIKDLTTGVTEDIYLVIETLGDVGEVDFNGKQVTPDKVSDDCFFGRVLVNKPVNSVITYSNHKYKILEIGPIDYNTFFDN